MSRRRSFGRRSTGSDALARQARATDGGGSDKRFGGDGGGGGGVVDTAADIDGLLGQKALPYRPDDAHLLEGEIFDLFEVMNEGKEGEIFDLFEVMNEGKDHDAWIANVTNPSTTEKFSHVMDEPAAEARAVLLGAIDKYLGQTNLVDPLAGSYVKSFVKNHPLHAALPLIDEHEDLVGGAAKLVDDSEAFGAVVEQVLATVAVHGEHGVDELKCELQRLGLLSGVITNKEHNYRAGLQRPPSLTFSRTSNVYNAELSAHTFEVTIGGVTIDCVDHGTYLVQNSGVARKNACVLISACEAVALAKGVGSDLGEMLDSFQNQARLVRRLLGPLDDREYITNVEREIREQVHDVLHDGHDMSINVFQYVSVEAFKDTTVVGIYADKGRVTEVRAVMGEHVSGLEADQRFVVGQLYYEGHATMVSLSSARDEDGNHVDLLAPGAIGAFFGGHGVGVEVCEAGPPAHAIATRGGLSGSVAVASLPPCPACASSSSAWRASGAGAARRTVVGGEPLR